MPTSRSTRMPARHIRHGRRLRPRRRQVDRARVPADGATAVGTELEVEILGERRAARVVSQPLFDPQGKRLTA